MSDLTSGGMVSFDPEGAPAAPEIADKGMMLSYAHIFAGLIPQPGDGGIVYVLGDADDAACLSQAWAPAAAAPAAAATENGEQQQGQQPAPSDEIAQKRSVSFILKNATIAIAPPPPAYLLHPKAKSPPTAEGRGRGRDGG